jgi:hypothetical protein
MSHIDYDGGSGDEEKLKHVPMLYVTCHYCGFRDYEGGRPGKHDRGKDRPFMSTILPTLTPVDRMTSDDTYVDTIWIKCYPGDESNTFYCRDEKCWQKECNREIKIEEYPRLWSKEGVNQAMVNAIWE